MNALLEPNGCLSLSERGVIDGVVPTIKPHPEFRYEHVIDSRLQILRQYLNFSVVKLHFIFASVLCYIALEGCEVNNCTYMYLLQDVSGGPQQSLARIL